MMKLGPISFLSGSGLGNGLKPLLAAATFKMIVGIAVYKSSFFSNYNKTFK